MSPKIIADTSIWIEYFKGNDQIAGLLEEHILKNNIHINGIIVAELIQGIKGNKDREAVLSGIDAVTYMEFTYEDWLLAGNLSSELRKNRLTIPLTDIATAAMAINNNMSVFTLDKHFEHIPGVKLCNKY